LYMTSKRSYGSDGMLTFLCGLNIKQQHHHLKRQLLQMATKQQIGACRLPACTLPAPPLVSITPHTLMSHWTCRRRPAGRLGPSLQRRHSRCTGLSGLCFSSGQEQVRHEGQGLGVAPLT
jgi:hypothetical protein